MLVGEPVPVADLLAEAEAAAWGEQKLQVAIADRVGQVRRQPSEGALLQAAAATCKWRGLLASLLAARSTLAASGSGGLVGLLPPIASPSAHPKPPAKHACRSTGAVPAQSAAGGLAFGGGGASATCRAAHHFRRHPAAPDWCVAAEALLKHYTGACAPLWGSAACPVRTLRVGVPLTRLPAGRSAGAYVNNAFLLPTPVSPAEEEMDSLAHCWHDRWQRVSLPSLTQRMREAVATRRDALRARLAAVGEGGAAAAALQELQPPAEEPDSPAWELAGGVSLPWGSPSATEGAAWEAAAAGPAGATDAALGLLARQNLLRLLRGGSALPAGLRASTGAGGSAAGLLPGGSLLGGGSKADIVAASPLDAVSLAAGSPDAGLLAATADYAALRAQHMRSLLAARPANSSMTAAVPAL